MANKKRVTMPVKCREAGRGAGPEGAIEGEGTALEPNLD
jgi:hypothetical protein